MTIIPTTVGKKTLKKKWSSPHNWQNSSKCSTWVQSQRWWNDLGLFPRKTIQYHSNQVSAPTTEVKEAKVEWFYEDLQHQEPRTHTKKDVLFITGDWNVKVGNQETPRVSSRFGLGAENEAGQTLTEFCQENMLVIANIFFQQQKRWIYT